MKNRSMNLKSRLISFGAIFVKSSLMILTMLLVHKYAYATDPFLPGREGFNEAAGQGSTVQYYFIAGAGLWCAYKTLGDWTVKQAAGSFIGIVILIFVINLMVFS